MAEQAIIPAHVGIILDGNRRWARERGLQVFEGHQRGADVLKVISAAAFERGVQYVTAFVFSTENWQRTEKEVSFLMGLVSKVAEKYLAQLRQENVRVVVLGSRDSLSDGVRKVIEKTEAETRDNTGGTLGVCFNYGGREEIAAAARALVRKGMNPDQITADSIAAELYAPEIPPLDLLIRTSGERRTSGFMLYRADYAELYFEDKYWPDYTEGDLDQALHEYAQRKRRFGA